MARLLALCSLPRTNPGNQHQYTRVNGPYKLIMSTTGEYKLPFGHLPRLLMAWISTEAVRTQSRVLILGDSLSDFMRSLGIYSSDGKAYTRLRNQMDRLFNASVRLIYEDEHGKQFVSSAIADRGEFWWDPKRPNERVLWDSKIRLGEDFFNEIIRHPVPLDMNTLTAMKRSPLGLDLYMWVAYRTFTLNRPLRLSWPTPLPAVWSGPGQGGRQLDRSEFSPRLPTGAEEDQTGLAGLELCDGSGRPDPASFDSYHSSVTRSSTPRGIAFPGLSAARDGLGGLSWTLFSLHFSNRPERANRLFPQVCVSRWSFPRAFTTLPFRAFTTPRPRNLRAFTTPLM